MRFTIKKDEFAKSLNIVSKAISQNFENPILRNVQLTLKDNCLFLIGSNLTLTIKTFIPCSFEDKEIIRNYKEGSVLINAKHLFDTVSRLNTNEIVFEVVDSIAVITSDNGKSRKELTTISSEEYPDIDLETDGKELVLSKKDFFSLINQTSFAASARSQDILSAINLVAENGYLTATTTDSLRMAFKKVKIDSDIQFVSNVPARTMVEIAHLIESSNDVKCYISDRKDLFSFDRTLVSTSLFPNQYPPTKGVLNKPTNYTLEINSQDLINAIESTRIMALDRENAVDLNLTEDTCEFTAKSTQAGSAFEQVEVFKFEGEPLNISFNSELLLAAVKGLGCQDVVIKFGGVMKPFLVLNPSDDSVIQIVTSLRPYN